MEKAKLEPINADPEDNFGIAVTISGETVVVGADAGDGGENTAPGTAYVFERNADGSDRWGQTTRLAAGEQRDFFGGAVGISGDLLAIGAPGHNEGGASSTADSMFLFDLSSGAWFFTGQVLYPNLFSFGRNAWVFYFERTSAPRQFVDLGSGEFFGLE